MKGLTYFEPGRFSINEGRFPNVHLDWRDGLYVYLALGHWARFSFRGRRVQF